MPIALTLPQEGNAQRDIQTNYETWWGVMTSVQFHKRWSFWNDAHFVDNLFFIYRTGITYHNPKDNMVVTVGYGNLNIGTPFSQGDLIRNEHRPWGQIIYRVPSTQKLSTSFRFRYDGRFMQDFSQDMLLNSYSFNSRWRFNNALRYRWGALGSSGIVLTNSFLNESLITTGPVQNGFPFEHRTHLLFGFSRAQFAFSVGWIARYIALRDPTQARINQGMVFWLNVNLQTRKMRVPEFKEFPSDHSE